MKSALDLFCLFHDCSGRNHCGKTRILARLPKRSRKWDIENDHEIDEAWGLNTTFSLSMIHVIGYHGLILLGPMVFWGM